MGSNPAHAILIAFHRAVVVASPGGRRAYRDRRVESHAAEDAALFRPTMIEMRVCPCQ